MHAPTSTPARSTLRRGNVIPRLLAILAAAFLLAVIFRNFGATPALADWNHDWNLALDASAKDKKPMLVLFTADWCGPCQQLKRDVLADSSVAPTLKDRFTLMKVDLTNPDPASQRIAEGYGVEGIPTLIVFNSKGDQIGRVSGSGGKSEMIAWFDQMHAKAK